MNQRLTLRQTSMAPQRGETYHGIPRDQSVWCAQVPVSAWPGPEGPARGEILDQRAKCGRMAHGFRLGGATQGKKTSPLGKRWGKIWFKHHLSGRIIITSGLNMSKPMGGPTLVACGNEAPISSPARLGLWLLASNG